MNVVDVHLAEEKRSDRMLRGLVHDGDLNLDTYLLKCIGVNPEHLEERREQYAKVIFGRPYEPSMNPLVEQNSVSIPSEEIISLYVQALERHLRNETHSDKYKSIYSLNDPYLFKEDSNDKSAMASIISFAQTMRNYMEMIATSTALGVTSSILEDQITKRIIKDKERS